MQSGPKPSDERSRRVRAAGATSDLSGQDRRRLAQLLADPRLDGTRLLHRLRELRSLEGLDTCAATMHLLAHLQVSEADAEKLLTELVRHRADMRERLGRDPGLQVAAIDFLANVRAVLVNPAVIELSQLEQTERFAITDPLTDLYNRRYFQGALDIEIRRSRRYSLEFALLMLDLDSFKSVNDVYGHPFGDRVLRRAGQIVRRAVRESDTATRFGGEEFCIILPETGRLGALAVAERVRQIVQQRFADETVDGRLVAMTISGGVACFPADGESASELVACADAALYRAKTTGRNKIVIHHSEKRHAVRYPAKRAARARLVVRPAQAATPARPLNLSSSGALLETAEPCRPADAVELTIDAGSRTCTLAARVVRVEPEQGRIAVAFERPLPGRTLLGYVTRGPMSWVSFGGNA